MKKLNSILSIVFLLFPIIGFAETQINSSFYRWGGNYPLDNTTVYTNYEDAVKYAAGGKPSARPQDRTSAYKGQYLAVLEGENNNSVYFIGDDWNLHEIGSGLILHAGETEDGFINPYSFETERIKDLYIKMDYNPEHSRTSFTNIILDGTNYLTLLIPQRGQKGADGSANVFFEGWWDSGKKYESVNQIVSYDGSLYINVAPIESGLPPPDVNSNWRKIVKKGDKGDKGDTGEITIGKTTTGEPGTEASVTNSGTTTDAVLEFTIPRGLRGIPGLGLTYRGLWESNTTYPSNIVVRHGTNLWYTDKSNDVEPPGDQDNEWWVFLQDGNRGPAGTIQIGTVQSSLPDSQAVVTNRGTPENAILDFKIPKGRKGDPGNSFGIYSGSWETGKNYTSNTWFTYGNATYGVVSNFTSLVQTSPTNYVATGEVVLLSKSGEDGKNGGQFAIYGDWSPVPEYKQFNMVRRDNTIYYCQSMTSSNQPPEEFENVWKVFVKDGEDAPHAIVTTNTTWAGKFQIRDYKENSLVYYDQQGYGVYYVKRNCFKEDIAEHYPEILNNISFFEKIASYGKDGKDGKPGDPGEPGVDGVNGADGVGNLWFGGEWAKTKDYEPNTIVSWTNDNYGYSMYLAIQEGNEGIEPGVNQDWSHYWQLLARSGTNGVDGKSGINYRFGMGWDVNLPYTQDDICVVSNNFYLAVQDSTGVEPWKDNDEDFWLKLISPDFRYYPTMEAEEWVITGFYEPKQIVRHKGSTWLCIAEERITGSEPGVDDTAWVVLAKAGDKGDPGPSIWPQVEETITLPPGQSASVDARLNGTNVFYTFGIPQGQRGFPGVNLVYFEEWDINYPYPTNSLVRWGTNLWYTTEECKGKEPGVAPNWSIYLSDGKAANVKVDPNVVTLTNETDEARVEITPYGGGNDVSLKFFVPRGLRGERGFQGDAGVGLSYHGIWKQLAQYPSNALVRHGTNLWWTKIENPVTEPGTTEEWEVFLADGPSSDITIDRTDTLPPESNAFVKVTHIEDSPDISLLFGIPQGYKGDRGDRGLTGAGVVYCGPFDNDYKYIDEHGAEVRGYPSNSLVRLGTNLWWNKVDTTLTPGTRDAPWEIFLSDGKPTTLTVDKVVDKLEPDKSPYVSNYVTASGLGLHFGVPRGEKGLPGDQGKPGAGLVYYGDFDLETSGLDYYPSNSLVRYGTNLWWNKIDTPSTPGVGTDWKIFISDGIPANVSVVTNLDILGPNEKGYITTNHPGGVANNLELKFHIPRGIKGDTIWPHIEQINMMEPEAVPSTELREEGTNVYYTFNIPRGFTGHPGANLVFFGNWKTNTAYASNSLVRYGTNTWYYLGEGTTETEPGGEDAPWKVFMADGKPAEVYVNPIVEKLDPNEEPRVDVDPIAGGNNVTLSFHIPQGYKGETGDTITPIAKETVQLEHTEKAYVTNQIDGSNMNLYFGIPKGIPGVNAVFYGDWESSHPDYLAQSMVRHGTNVWYTEELVSATVEPGTEGSPWKKFMQDGDQGPQGKAANVTVTRIVDKLNPDQTPYVDIDPVSGGNDVNLTFHIPQGYQGERGFPGAGLFYVGNYAVGAYTSNSLVKDKSVLWYTLVDTETTPGAVDSDWLEFLSPTKIAVKTNGTSTAYGTNPSIKTNYDAINNILTMEFTIPEGKQGVTKTPMPSGNTYTVPPKSATQYGQAKVEYNSGLSTETESKFDFWIPAGLKGDKGDTGNNGTNATITVGGVTNVPPTEQNTLGEATFNVVPGENNSYALHFGIPAGIKGDQGIQGLKGDNGAGLVPKGGYSPTNIYYTNEMVRFDGAQYYVNDTAPSEGISGKAPNDPNYGSYWTMFLQDGQSIAGDASTLVSLNELNIETQYLGKVLLDTNTLVVVETNTPIGTYNTLTVVGGPGGGGSKQWEIDEEGNMMPAAEMYAGQWEYDDNRDIMPPPITEDEGREARSVASENRGYRIITSANDIVLPTDSIIWMDADSAGTNQTLVLPRMNSDLQTVTIHQLSRDWNTTIQYVGPNNVTNEFTISDNERGVTADWLGARTNWFWRN